MRPSIPPCTHTTTHTSPQPGVSSYSDKWPGLLHRFPNRNNLGTKQVAVYHIDFPPNLGPFKAAPCLEWKSERRGRWATGADFKQRATCHPGTCHRHTPSLFSPGFKMNLSFILPSFFLLINHTPHYFVTALQCKHEIGNPKNNLLYLLQVSLRDRLLREGSSLLFFFFWFLFFQGLHELWNRCMNVKAVDTAVSERSRLSARTVNMTAVLYLVARNGGSGPINMHQFTAFGGVNSQIRSTRARGCHWETGVTETTEKRHNDGITKASW